MRYRPRARDFREALHSLMILGEEVGHLLIDLDEMLLDRSKFFQRRFQ